MIEELKIDPLETSKKIEEFISKKMNELKREGAVLGLSGGLDSALAAILTVRSLGNENVHLINMPERDSKSTHQKHARLLAKLLECKYKVKKISPIIRKMGTYKILPIGYIPGKKLRRRLVRLGRDHLIEGEEKDFAINRFQSKADTWTSRANAYAMAKHRIRMLIVYQYAEEHNLLVVGAANRTEWLTGTFSQFGIDSCADVMPIIHLYRSQLEVLAKYLRIPNYILNKPADPDIMPTVDDKGLLLGGKFSFEGADEILYQIENRNLDKNALYEKYDKNIVDRLFKLYELSAYYRETPYHL